MVRLTLLQTAIDDWARCDTRALPRRLGIYSGAFEEISLG